MSSISYNLGGIAKVTLPMILTALSANLMYVADRMILAHYSIDAMNAVSISSNMVSIVSYLFISIACVAEIYVGQYNGSNQTKNLAKPVWQMIYLSLFASIFFIPLGYFAKHINLLPSYYESDGVAYQSILTYFCSITCLVAAISAFFIGQGKTAIVTIVVVIGNLINILLDVIFIFGVDDIIPALGSSGAAIATVSSEFIQVVILFSLFCRRSNRRDFDTLKNRKFDKKIFVGCCKIGAPLSIGRLFEISAWYAIYVAMSHVSKDMATVHGIASNIFILFVFFEEGLSKSIATLSANLIGMKDLDGIKKLYKIFCIATIFIGFLIAIPLVLCPGFILKLLGLVSSEIAHLYPDLLIIFKILVINIILETLGCVTWGILMAGGDSKYPIIANISCIWVLVVIPIIVMYYTQTLTSAVTMWQLCSLWCLVSFLFIYKRYKSLKWYHKLV